MMTIGFPGSNVTPRKRAFFTAAERRYIRNYSVNRIRITLYQVMVKSRYHASEWRVSACNPPGTVRRGFFQDFHEAREALRRAIMRHHCNLYKLKSY